MLKSFARILCLWLALTGLAHAQSNKVQSPWLPLGKGTAISVTTASLATQLPTGGNVAWLCNTGSNDAYVRFGPAVLTVTVANGSWLKAGTCGGYDLQPVTGFSIYVATITGSSTTSISVETGIGNPPLNSLGSGGGGGTTAVTLAAGAVSAGAYVVGAAVDGWDLTQGAQADAACGSDNGTCSVIALLKRENQRLTSILGALSSVPVTGTFWQATQPVSAASLPLPTGASTETTLAAINTKTPALGQATSAASVPVVWPSDPDLRPSTGTITVQDTASSTTTGQNGASITTGTPTASSFQSQAINGQNTARILVTGTWTGTITFEGSVDSGTTWTTLPNRVSGSSYTQGSITGNGLFDTDASALTNIRARATAAMTGTATIRFVFSVNSGPVQVLNPLRLFDNTSGASFTIKPASTPPLTTDTALSVGEADGNNVVLGATADTVAAAGGAGTISAKLRLLTTQFNTLNTTVALAANQTTQATNQTNVQGPVPAGAATATKFNLGGCEYRSTKPTITDGQQVPCQTGTRGSASIQVLGADSATGVAAFAPTNDVIAVQNGLTTATQNLAFDGTQWFRFRGDVTGGLWTQGAVASGAADSGNPLKMGGKYNSTKPTFSDGNRGDLQLGTRGSLAVTLFPTDSATALTLYNNADAATASITSMTFGSAMYLFNGSTMDRQRSITGWSAVGTGVHTSVPAPTSSANGANAYVSSTALEANHVIKASAGNLYSFEVSADATLSGAAWWVMVYDATSAPADGAVTPAKCYALPSGTTSYSAAFQMPIRLATGITIGVSTTGCFTKTASVHAFISGDAQ